jgi:hypothetical protein
VVRNLSRPPRKHLLQEGSTSGLSIESGTASLEVIS